LYENSEVRGKGVTFEADCPLHVNFTSALVETVDDARDTFEMFWSKGSNPACQTCPDPTIADCIPSSDITVLHAQAARIEEQERRAFALKNNTGQQIRIHAMSSMKEHLSGCTTTVYYLDHLQTMPLFFPATLTTIRNLKHIETPIEGDRNRSSLPTSMVESSNHHLVDIQIPGFQWLHGVSIEETGRQFIDLIPRSLHVRSKINNDVSNRCTILLHSFRRLTPASSYAISTVAFEKWTPSSC
jgi:hypothetical protein